MEHNNFIFNKLNQYFAFAFLLLFTVLSDSFAGIYYVSSEGNDANTGTHYTPIMAWKTIDHAASSVGAGDTVFVRPGVYKEEILIDSMGSFGSRIVFIGDTSASFFPDTTAGHVIIDGDSILNAGFMLDTSSYVSISGFTFRNQKKAAISIDPSHSNSQYIDIHHNTFESWNIDDLSHPAIALLGNTGYQLQSISIYQNTFKTSPTSHKAIMSTGAGTSNTNSYMAIYENRFHGVDTAIHMGANNTYHDIYGNKFMENTLAVYVTSHNRYHWFYNNVIKSDAPNGSAFYFNNATADSTQLIYNSIRVRNTGIAFASSTRSGVQILNNIFYISGNSSANRAIYLDGLAKIQESNYNLFYTPNGASVGFYEGTDYSTLADWKNEPYADSIADSLSIYGDPLFQSSGLFPEPGTPAFAKAVPVNAVDYGISIDNDIRDSSRSVTNPTIGAYELSTDEGWLIDTITDNRDGNQYEVIKIGDQWWMRENLLYGKVVSTSKGQTDNDTTEMYAYNNDSTLYYFDGSLYTWDEAMQYHDSENGLQGTTQGVCPDGWHIPTDNEWQRLETYLGMNPSDTADNSWRGDNQGAKLKSGGISGFEAVLKGRYTGSAFQDNGSDGYYWTATESTGTNAIMRRFSGADSRAYRFGIVKTAAKSVRCVKSYEVSGTFTIGGATPDFNTITEAVNYLKNGAVNGPVTFNIRTGTYNEQVIIPEILGADMDSRITFQSETGDSTDVVITYAPNADSNYVMLIDGTDYMTIQGITIQPTGSTYTNGIEFYNGANYLKFANNHFAGIQNNGSLLISTEGADHNVIIENNYFHQGENGVHIGGGPGNPELNTIIRHNHIVNTRSRGIGVAYSQKISINHNRINRVPGIAPSTISGIHLSDVINKSKIYNNIITIEKGHGIYVKYANNDANSPNRFYNNIISVGDDMVSANHGIWFQWSNDYNHLYHNTVAIYNENEASAALNVEAGNMFDVYNNIFSNLGGGYAISVSSSEALQNSDNNNLYSTDTVASFSGSGVTFFDWQNNYFLDTYSFNSNPRFTDSVNLVPANCILNDGGLELDTIVPYDYHGVARDTMPDLGAVEFSSSPISGTFYVGAGQDYETLQDALEALAGCGITGPVTMELTDAFYDENPVEVNGIDGISAENPVLIKPAAGANPLVHMQTKGFDGYGLKFTDVSHLTIDGSNDGTGSRNLEFTFSGGEFSEAKLLYFKPLDGDMDSITIKNTIITGYSNSFESANRGIFFSYEFSTTVNVNHSTIENNLIRRVKEGIYLEGINTSSLGFNNSIINNEIGHANPDSSVSVEGIKVFYQDSLLITGNEIYNITDTGDFAQDAIGMKIADVEQATISHNRIRDVFVAAGNTGYGATGIRIEFTDSIDLTLTNNVVSHIAAPGGSGAGYDATGIALVDYGAASNDLNIDVYHNSVFLSRDTVNGFSQFNSAAVALYLETYLDSVFDIRNNILHAGLGHKSGTTPSSTGYAIYSYYQGSPVFPFLDIDHNQYYSAHQSVNALGFSEDTTFYTIYDLRDYTEQDLNSHHASPLFTSKDNLKPQKYNVFANAGGEDLGIGVDFDNVARGATPDIGAYEYDAFSTLSGHIASNTSITDTIVVTDSLWIDNGAAVEIDPGTEIRVFDNDTVLIPIIINGRLDINGQPGDSAKIIPYSDRVWGGMIFENDADDASIIEHAVISTGQLSSPDTVDALQLNNVAITVKNTVLKGLNRTLKLNNSMAFIDSVIINMGMSGIGAGAMNSDQSVITHSTFNRSSSSNVPIKIDSSETSISSNIFNANGNVSFSIEITGAANDTIWIQDNLFNKEGLIKLNFGNWATVNVHNNEFHEPVNVMNNQSGTANMVNNLLFFPADYYGETNTIGTFNDLLSVKAPLINFYNNTVYSKADNMPTLFSADKGQGSGPSEIHVKNSIAWGYGFDPVSESNGGVVNIDYSNIQSYTGGGTANLDTFPGFKDTTELGLDLSLMDTSLMIDAGKPDFTSDSLATNKDLASLARFSNDTVDMGAYEFQFSAPNPPAGLTAKTIFKDRIDLSWMDNSPDEEGFVILRSTADSNSVVAIDSVFADVTAYVDTSVAPTTRYYYRLASFGNDLNSDSTAAAKAHTAISYYTNASVNQDTLWNTDTVKVTGHVTVYDGVSLTIDPGVYVEMQDSSEFNIYGTILAEGMAGDSITFTVKDTSGYASNSHTGWAGIRFIDVAGSNDTSRLDHTIIEYSKLAAVDANTLTKGILSNSRISSNARGLRIWDNSTVKVTGNEILHNKTNDEAGAGIYINSSSPLIEGNLIKGNVASGGVTRHGGGILALVNSEPTIINNTISHNESGGLGGGLYIHSNGYVENNIIEHNYSNSSGAGVYLNAYDSVFVKNTIRYNESNSSAGGLYLTNMKTADITDNTIAYNTAGNSAGGIYITQTDTTLHIIQNLVHHNKAYTGGGMAFQSNTGQLNVINNTLVMNEAENRGGGLAMNSSDVDLKNNILHYNHVNGSWNQIHLDADIPGDFIYNNLQQDTGAITGGNAFTGAVSDNIALNPMFSDTLNDDFNLTECSPSVNAGVADTTGMRIPADDLNGNPRVYDGTIDQGVYEFQNLAFENPDFINISGDSIVAEGDDVELAVVAYGDSLEYQWEESLDGGLTWNPIAGQNDSLLDIANVPSSYNGRKYRNIISGYCPVNDTSYVVMLKVSLLPKLEIVEDTIEFPIQPPVTDMDSLNLFIHNTGDDTLFIQGTSMLTSPFDFMLDTPYILAQDSALLKVYLDLNSNPGIYEDKLIIHTQTNSDSIILSGEIEPFIIPGNALAFDDQNNQYVNVADDNALDLTNNYTLEAWVKVNSFTYLGGILSKFQNAGANGYHIKLHAVQPYRGIMFDGKMTSAEILDSSKWYHIAGVNDNGTRKLYINGEEVSLISGTAINTSVNDNDLRFGVDYSSRYLNGSIDEVRIWNEVRTQAEIKSAMHEELTGIETGLVGYYDFNRVKGDTLPDLTTNGLNGALQNMTDTNWTKSGAVIIPFADSAISITTSSFVARWDSIPDATGYILDVAEDSLFALKIAGYDQLYVPGNASYEVTGLSPGNAYYYRVRSVTTADTSDWSNIIKVTSGTAILFDFNHYVLGDFGGQEDWVTQQYGSATDIQVTASDGYDSTQALYYDQVGSGYGADASILLDGSGSNGFAFDDMQSMYRLSYDIKENHWGVYISFGPDANNDGYVTKSDAGELAFKLRTQGHAADRIELIDGTVIDEAFTTNYDWNRVEMLIYGLDNNDGKVAVRAKALGTNKWNTMVDETELGVDTNASDKSNIKLWDALMFHIEGGTAILDNISLEKLDEGKPDIRMDSIDFGTQVEAPDYDTLSFYVYNTGNDELTIDSIGGFSAPYDYDMLSMNVAEGDSVLVDVIQDMNYVGTFTDTLVIYSNVWESSIILNSELLPANEIPVALDDAVEICEKETIIADVLANDSDADMDALTTIILSMPLNGSATVLNSDSIEYTPDAGFSGNDTIVYEVSDGVDTDTAALVISVNALPVIDLTNDTTICEGETITLSASGGDTYLWSNSGNTAAISVAPTYDTLYSVMVTGVNGCMKEDTVHVFVNPIDSTYEYVEICEGENYLGYDSTGIYFETYTNQFGCDSIITTNLTVNPIDSTYEYVEICEGENYLGYDSTGIYFETYTNQFGCDSIVEIEIWVNDVDTIYDYAEICEGESYLGYDSTGIYYETYTNQFGCDSIVEIEIWVNDVDTIYDYAEICEGESYLGYDSTGIYYETYTNQFGCDSVLEIEVVMNYADSTYLYGEICQGSSFMGYDSAGVYYESHVNQYGCDSIVEIEVVVSDTINVYHEVVICAGETYTLPGGDIADSDGIYVDSLISELGCDSIITTSLTVGSIDSTYQYMEICEGESYLGIDSSGTYYINYQNQFGCDSIVELEIWVHPVDTTYEYVEICEGDVYMGYDSTGIYYQTFTNEFGCDSVVEMELIVNNTAATNESMVICEGESYMGYNQTGTYVDSLLTANGCDSIVTLDLTVLDSDTTYLSGSICEGESFRGYTEAGIFVEYYQNADGCDSILIIEVTAYPAPLADAGDDISIIKGDSVQLQASGGVRYLWNNGNTLSNDTLANPWARPPDTLMYYVRVRNEFGCEVIDSVRINVREPLDNQVIALAEGWNIFSLNIEPSAKPMIDIVQPLIDSNALVQVQDEAGNTVVNLEGEWIDFIGNHKATEGYQVKLSEPTELNIQGVSFEDQILVNLTEGWNIISYPGQSAKDAQVVLSSLLSGNYLKKAQDETGASMEQLPPLGWINNIGDFTPGEGYRIRVNSNALLRYGKNKQKKSADEPGNHVLSKTENFNPVWQGNGYNHMNIYLKDATINGMPLVPGDEIAVFDGNICVGVVKFEAYNQGYVPVAVSKDDPVTPETDGFTPGNPVSFKIWSSRHQLVTEEITVHSSDQSELVFNDYEKAIVRLKAKAEATSIFSNQDLQTAIESYYPNPFHEKLTINYSVSQKDNVTIQVYNLLGEQVIHLVDRIHEPGNYQAEWNRRGEDNHDVPSGVYILRMKSGFYSETIRITVY